MIRYAGSRLVQGVIALLVVVTAVFALARLKGDPAALLAPPDATPAEIVALRHSLGYDRSNLTQFGSYLNHLLHGDLGRSTSYSAPVRSLVATAFGETAKLALVAFVFALVVGGALGLLSGMRRGGAVDGIVKVTSLLGQSVPSFWLGILLILVFAVHLNVLPAVGNDSPQSVLLPAVALGAFPLASFARLTRSAVIDLMSKDQTLFLRTKGLSPSTVVVHIVRNASLPVVTLAGIQLGTLISGTIVIETLFGWPGIGQLAIQAISSRDYSLIQGIVIANTLVFLVLLFLVDLSYGLLDPRIRRAHAGSTA